jgi:hypothetical protein
MQMPIYKIKNSKKEGLQKYCVRINYVDDSGAYKQLNRIAYGIEIAKDLERQLEHEIKIQQEMPIKKMTVKQLFDEYIAIKKYEVRETTLEKINQTFKLYILPMLENVRIDKLSVKVLQEWKLSIEKRKLSIVTKKNIYSELRTMLNYAVKMEHIPKHNLFKVRQFQRQLCFQKRNEFLHSRRI